MNWSIVETARSRHRRGVVSMKSLPFWAVAACVFAFAVPSRAQEAPRPALTDAVSRNTTLAAAQAVSPNPFGGAAARSSEAAAAQSRGGNLSSDRPHAVGLGGRAGGFTFGMGASGRAWQSDRLGVQVDLSHYGMSTIGITQVAPSVLFVLGEPDLSKPTQLRPYAGGGLNILHVSTNLAGYGFSNSSDTGLGGQGFVGAEMVFAGAPRFGLSADLGYYSTGTFFDISVGGFAASLAGHYYIK